MPLVTAEQLRDSLEGSQVDLGDFEDSALTEALGEAQALLNVTVHYDVEATYETTSDRYKLAQKFVRLAAVRVLSNSPGGTDHPTPAGAMLTGFQSESASFSFFTPSGDLTGYDDLDRLAQRIGIKQRAKISSIRMVT